MSTVQSYEWRAHAHVCAVYHLRQVLTMLYQDFTKATTGAHQATFGSLSPQPRRLATRYSGGESPILYNIMTVYFPSRRVFFLISQESRHSRASVVILHTFMLCECRDGIPRILFYLVNIPEFFGTAFYDYIWHVCIVANDAHYILLAVFLYVYVEVPLHTQGRWSWWLVLSPLWICDGIALFTLVFSVFAPIPYIRRLLRTGVIVFEVFRRHICVHSFHYVASLCSLPHLSLTLSVFPIFSVSDSCDMSKACFVCENPMKIQNLHLMSSASHDVLNFIEGTQNV